MGGVYQEFGRMWKEKIVGYFKVQHHYFPERNKKNTHDIAVVGFQAKNRTRQLLTNKTQENQPRGPA
jgi:hypothetical protein